MSGLLHTYMYCGEPDTFSHSLVYSLRSHFLFTCDTCEKNKQTIMGVETGPLGHVVHAKKNLGVQTGNAATGISSYE